MLLKQIIENTWQCDGLNCPAPPVIQDQNPYFVVRCHLPTDETIEPVEVALCPVCIRTITAPLIVAIYNPPPQEPAKADSQPQK